MSIKISGLIKHLEVRSSLIEDYRYTDTVLTKENVEFFVEVKDKTLELTKFL